MNVVRFRVENRQQKAFEIYFVFIMRSEHRHSWEGYRKQKEKSEGLERRLRS